LHYINREECHASKEARPHKTVGQKFPPVDIFIFCHAYLALGRLEMNLITAMLIPTEYWHLQIYQPLLFSRQHRGAIQQSCNGRGEFDSF
jgi:hypothetical protein